MQDAAYPWLVADIGGTNCRFGLVRGDGQPAADVIGYRCAEHPAPEAAAAEYLAESKPLRSRCPASVMPTCSGSPKRAPTAACRWP